MSMWLDDSPKGKTRKGSLQFIKAWLRNAPRTEQPEIRQNMDDAQAEFMEKLWDGRKSLLGANMTLS